MAVDLQRSLSSRSCSVIVGLLWGGGGGHGKVGGGSFMLGFGWRTDGGCQASYIFCSVFVLLLIVLS